MLTINAAIEQIHPKSVVNIFKNKYSSLIKEDLQSLIESGEKIAKNILNNPGKIQLIVGQVQSGKTATYLSVISNLFDGGSNFVFIAPAVDNILLNQTKDRLMDTFDTSSIKIFTINELKDGKQLNCEPLRDALVNGRKVILISLKNQMRLSDSKKAIKIVSDKLQSPVFIDDEGDQASFDNINKAERSAVHAEIVSIYKETNTGINLLTVTASPMAHILVDAEYSIKPDFVFYTKPGSEYLGIEEFTDEEKKHVVIIPEKDNEIFIDGGGVLPQSFREAVLSFFVSAAYIQMRDEKIDTQSMLLHIDKKIDSHSQIFMLTENLLKNMTKGLRKAESKYEKQVMKICDNLNISIQTNEIHLFMELIAEHIEFSKIRKVNGDTSSDDEVLSDVQNPRKRNYIYIGSSMLQRGVTIKNLIHTYFSYRKKGTINADTVLQRARWFGYRKNADLIRLYMCEDAVSDYIALSEMIPDMNEKIEVLERENISFKEYERSLYIPYANMRGTSESKVANSRRKLNRYLTNQGVQNSLVAEELFEELKNVKTKKMMDSQNFVGKEFENFIDFKEWIGSERFDQICSEIMPNKFDKKAFLDFIETEKPKFFIANMYTLTDEFRVRTQTGERISITQGHGNEQKGYVGDRYWYKDPSGKYENAVILQLFRIKIKDSDKEIFKCALVSSNRIHGYYIHAMDGE